MEDNKSQNPRKLAVILHADVADSTSLVRQNESLAHDRITGSFKNLAQSTETYGGEVREIRGDALVAEFGRASDAVCAALEFQRIQSVFLEQFDDPIRPEVRVGISLGEVIVADDTITGEGIVLAQRIEQLARPGGICVTAAVHEALPGRLPLTQKDLGELALKGFDEKIRAYEVELQVDMPVPPPERISQQVFISSRSGIHLAAMVVLLAIAAVALLWDRNSGIVETEAIGGNLPVPGTPSIAVLPFTNIGGNPEQDYFVDGLTEDLITDISKVSGIFVIARGTAFTYKHKPIATPQVADELGVRYVLEGSVRRAGNRLRINTQLTDAATGSSLWAERYDRELEDIFTIQDEITDKIVQALEVRLSAREKTAVNRRSTSNFAAYELFLQGQRIASMPDRDGLAEAIRVYQQALELDPGFSRAYGAISYAMMRQYVLGYSDAPFETLNRALEMAQRGVAIGQDLPQVYYALGFAHLFRKELDQGLAATQKAIEIAPGFADAHGMLALIFNHLGNHEAGLDHITHAMELNPFYSWQYIYTRGYAHYLAGEYELAVENMNAALEKNATAGTPRIFLIASHVRLEDLDEAVWEAEQLQIYNPEMTLSHIRRIWPHSDDFMDALIADLQAAGVPG